MKITYDESEFKIRGFTVGEAEDWLKLVQEKKYKEIDTLFTEFVVANLVPKPTSIKTVPMGLFRKVIDTVILESFPDMQKAQAPVEVGTGAEKKS